MIIITFNQRRVGRVLGLELIAVIKGMKNIKLQPLQKSIAAVREIRKEEHGVVVIDREGGEKTLKKMGPNTNCEAQTNRPTLYIKNTEDRLWF